MSQRVEEVGKSEGQIVIIWIQIETSLGAKAGPRPTGLDRKIIWRIDLRRESK